MSTAAFDNLAVLLQLMQTTRNLARDMVTNRGLKVRASVHVFEMRI